MTYSQSIINTEPTPAIKRSLILAGGGVRLAYQAGVLQALQEENLTFTHFDGTSGGIFNTAMLASGISPDEMAENWRKLKIKYFMSALPIKSYLKPFRLAAIGDADGIRKGVFPGLGIDLEKIRNNQEIHATFNVCNFSDKAVESIPNTEVTEDHLIAGVSLPIFMPALRIGNSWYSDAVWIKDANLMGAVKKGAEEIWVIWAIGNTPEYLSGSFNQYVHMIEMSGDGGLLEEFEQIKVVNERIQKGDSPYGQKKPIRVHMIKPEYPLPLDPDLFLGKIDAATLINMGYADTKKYLSQRAPEGVALDKHASAMSSPGIKLSFRHWFSGTLKMDGKLVKATFNPSFNLHKFDNGLKLYSDNSVFIDLWGKTVSTYDNQTLVKKDGSKLYININSALLIDKNRYQFQAQIPLSSFISWLLGLEFKSVKIKIFDPSSTENQPLVEGTLYQSLAKRIKSLFKKGFFSPSNSGRIKEKNNMMRGLYRLNNTD